MSIKPLTWREPYQELQQKPFMERLGIYLAEKPAAPPSFEAAMAEKKSGPQFKHLRNRINRKYRQIRLEQALHHDIHYLPRLIVNTAAQVNGTVREGHIFRNVLKAHTSLHNWKKTRNKIHLTNLSAALILIVSNIAIPHFAGVINDFYGISELTIKVLEEVKKPRLESKKIIILSARIAIRAAAIFTHAYPPAYLTVQLIKAGENGIDAFVTLYSSKKITVHVLLEAATNGLPAVMRVVRQKHLIQPILKQALGSYL